MFNPLLPDLTAIKNEDLDNKITELMQKYFIAARSGMGGVCNQINVLLEAHKDEQRRRHAQASSKLINQNKHLDDYISRDS
jgi:hypothetical protein